MAYTPFDLTGKVALVTGGNSGIGLGMALAMAQAGADIAIWGTNAAKNAAAAETLAPTGRKVLTRWRLGKLRAGQGQRGVYGSVHREESSAADLGPRDLFRRHGDCRRFGVHDDCRRHRLGVGRHDVEAALELQYRLDQFCTAYDLFGERQAIRGRPDRRAGTCAEHAGQVT